MTMRPPHYLSTAKGYKVIPALGAEWVSRVPSAPEAEWVSGVPPKYHSLIGAVNLDELVAPVAEPASANQRPSHHLVRDVLTSKGL